MGGNIALNLALAHPDTVTKLILCDTGAGSEDAAAFKARCKEYAQAAEKSMEFFFQAVVSSDYGGQGDMAATIPGAQIWRVPNATHFIIDFLGG